jgi:hypothetical protein
MTSNPNYCSNWNLYRNPAWQGNFIRPWSRATLACMDLSGSGITDFDLNMRRKAEVLSYKHKSGLTKKERWAKLNRGEMYKKRAWATQNFTYTNPNVNNLDFVTGSTTTLTCSNDPPELIKNPTSASDVPGKIIDLYLDEDVPLINYKNRVTFSAGGTKYPESSWQIGDNGFPVGKSGSNNIA